MSPAAVGTKPYLLGEGLVLMSKSGMDGLVAGKGVSSPLDIGEFLLTNTPDCVAAPSLSSN